MKTEKKNKKSRKDKRKELNRQIIKELAVVLIAHDALENAIKDIGRDIGEIDRIAARLFFKLHLLVKIYSSLIDTALDEANKAIRGLANAEKKINSAIFAFTLIDLKKEYFQEKIPIGFKNYLAELFDAASEELDKKAIKEASDTAEALLKRIKYQL